MPAATHHQTENPSMKKPTSASQAPSRPPQLRTPEFTPEVVQAGSWDE